MEILTTHIYLQYDFHYDNACGDMLLKPGSNLVFNIIAMLLKHLDFSELICGHINIILYKYLININNTYKQLLKGTMYECDNAFLLSII